jgi:DNA-binding beta-propeller fold protein YncE
MGALLQNTVFGRQKRSKIYYKGDNFSGLTLQTCVKISPDGTKMYVANAREGFYQYNLTTPNKVSTAVYNSKKNWVKEVTAFCFSPNGLKLYATRQYKSNVAAGIEEYTLSTAWEISTAILVNFKGFVNQSNENNYVSISPDGRYMFVNNFTTIDRFELSIPWDIMTMTQDQSIDIWACRDILISEDGKYLYAFNTYNKISKQYLLIPFDLQSIYKTETITILSEAIVPGNFQSFSFNADGTRMIYGVYYSWVYGFELSVPYGFNADLIT